MTSREEIEEDLEIDIDPRFTRGANFRWSSDVDEGVVAFCFAGALARLVNGLVLDVDGETMLTADETIARARKDLKDTTPPPRQRGTRPADIRHYLKSLLEQRERSGTGGSLCCSSGRCGTCCAAPVSIGPATGT